MKKIHWVLLGILLIMFVWSMIRPYDSVLWILEALPVIIAVPILLFTFKKFQFTNLSYIFICIHCCILLQGAHYSYAREPFFEWMNEIFSLGRNNYDKVGHFAQGFIPALLARELLIRLNIVNVKSWISFLAVSICLSISALYELFELLIPFVQVKVLTL